MPRSATLFVIVLVGCGRTEPTTSAPPPAVSSSVPPLASAAVAPEPSASASASPVRQPLPGYPALDGTCSTDGECAPVFFDDQCCSQCEPRVGNKRWADRVKAFCTSKDGGAGARACEPRACSWAFGRPRCVDGGCASR